MKCPECGRGSRVLNTRYSKGVTVRYRRCVNDHRFQTEEKVKGEKEGLSTDEMIRAMWEMSQGWRKE